MTTNQPTTLTTPLPAHVTNASSVAPADAAARLATVDELLMSIYSGMRKRAILDAVLMELVERNNGRIAAGKPPIGKLGATPRPPLYYLANSMKNARAHDRKVWEMTSNDNQTTNP